MLVILLYPIDSRQVLRAEVPYTTTPPAMATTGTHFTKAPLNIKSDFASIAREYGVYETAIGDHELVVKQYTQPPQDSPIKVLELGMGCRRVITSFLCAYAVLTSNDRPLRSEICTEHVKNICPKRLSFMRSRAIRFAQI
jgi:hypothetical protein